MRMKLEGLILRDLTVGDNDRIVTVLTREKGIIGCYVKGANSLKHSNFASTKPLTFSRLTIYQGRGMYIIDEAEIIRSFRYYDLDLERLALSQYLCELAIKTVPENVPSEGQLELLLNCMHVLTEGLRPCEVIKAVYEIRLTVNSGNMPNIIYCSGCGCYESDIMYFNYEENTLTCSSCCSGEGTVVMLSRGAMTAFRYIVLSEPKKIFSFTASEGSLGQLADCAEKYAVSFVGKRLGTLEYYTQVKALG